MLQTHGTNIGQVIMHHVDAYFSGSTYIQCLRRGLKTQNTYIDIFNRKFIRVNEKHGVHLRLCDTKQ